MTLVSTTGSKTPTRGLPLLVAAAAAATFGAAGSASAKPPSSQGNGPGQSHVQAPVAPSAFELDLTATNTFGTVTAGGAIFTRTDIQPTGTGVIRPFVRLQSPGSSPTENGHNTSNRPLQNDENNSPQFTRTVRLSDLGTTQINGVDYYQFLLDVNEPNGGSKELLSLDALEIYQSDNPLLNDYSPADGFGDEATLVYDLDADTDRYIKLDANLESRGSGAGDMYGYIPASLFGEGEDHLYLYSRFGDHHGADGGFEEWAGVTGRGAAAVPLPPAVWMGLATMGLMGVGAFRRVRSGRRVV